MYKMLDKILWNITNRLNHKSSTNYPQITIIFKSSVDLHLEVLSIVSTPLLLLTILLT
jgi:hypothetical protein